MKILPENQHFYSVKELKHALTQSIDNFRLPYEVNDENDSFFNPEKAIRHLINSIFHLQAQVDITAINTVTERLENVIEEMKKPNIVEHQHYYTLDIRSNWFFLSWIALVIIILGLFWAIARQRQTINRYRESDLKYRYIRMQGQTDEESLHRLEQQFQYGDSIQIIRKQVERYEEVVKEQAERIERAKRDSEVAEELRKEVESVKSRK